SVFSSGLRVTADGASPTSASRAVHVSGSIVEIVPVVDAPVKASATISDPLDGATVSFDFARRPPRFETKILPEPLATVTPNGAIPTSTSRAILRVAVSITASVLFRLKATYAVFPSGENAMPLGTG